jgi:hypothetical protein
MFTIVTRLGGKLIAYPILVAIISVAHYAFAGMSMMFEIVLWIFKNEQFKTNMININTKMDIVRKMERDEKKQKLQLSPVNVDTSILRRIISYSAKGRIISYKL